jgi:hypothetical protein
MVLAIAVCATVVVPASADRSFAPRFSATDRGQVLTAGNTVMTCPGSGASCRAVQGGTSTTTNGDLDMDYVDVDGDSATFNSTRATLALPSGRPSSSPACIGAATPARAPVARPRRSRALGRRCSSRPRRRATAS